MSAETCPHCGASMLGDPISPKALVYMLHSEMVHIKNKEERPRLLVTLERPSR